MTPIFADTSFYLALLSRDDAWHEAALLWSEDNSRPLVLTEFVLLELGNALADEPARACFVELVGALRADHAIEIVPATPELFNEGFRLFAERPDKRWSLTDCISFVVMRQHGITEALTGDHHFAQAGFSILLK